MSEDFFGNVTSSSIETSYKSDHSSVSIEINLENFVPGRGLWKYNDSLLKEKDYNIIYYQTSTGQN